MNTAPPPPLSRLKHNSHTNTDAKQDGTQCTQKGPQVGGLVVFLYKNRGIFHFMSLFISNFKTDI